MQICLQLLKNLKTMAHTLAATVYEVHSSIFICTVMLFLSYVFYAICIFVKKLLKKNKNYVALMTASKSEVIFQ